MNEQLITRTITEEISQRRLKWFCHVARLPQQCLSLQVYRIDFNIPRPGGRPPARWKDQVQSDLEIPIQDAEHHVQGRPEWRRITCRRAKGHTVLRA